MVWRNMVISALLLAAFAVVGTAVVALTEANTAERIAANERETLLLQLHQVVAASAHDNDLYGDTLQVTDPALLGTPAPVTVYRARRGGAPVAVVLTPVAPDGYSGDIRLLVGVYADGRLAGVRVLAHKETPGLGDAIEADRTDWVQRFSGRSLTDPTAAGWAVKKDGGVYDQFTGATITPRAVVKAVHNTLLYFQAHRDALFAPPEKDHG